MGQTVSMDRIRRLNRDAGRYWFEPDTLRFFRSRVAEKAYLAPFPSTLAYFVSSEQGPSGVRAYSVRVCDMATGEIDTMGEFQGYASRSGAVSAARRLAAGVS